MTREQAKAIRNLYSAIDSALTTEVLKIMQEQNYQNLLEAMNSLTDLVGQEITG